MPCLLDLLSGLGDLSPDLDAETEICRLVDDSRKVRKGDLFFAVPGSVENGERFASHALARGAVAVVRQESSTGTQEVLVENVREVLAEVAMRFYDRPFDKLSAHAVTGTNGKTTVSILLRNVLEKSGRACALSGTMYRVAGAEVEKATLTTPGVLELTEFAARAVANGCSDLVMEVSSHALTQNRLGGLKFRTAIFTNLSQDHLDYHGDMENYFEAKKLLFTDHLAEGANCIINVDNAWGLRLFAELVDLGGQIQSFSTDFAKSGKVSLVLELAEDFSEGMKLVMKGKNGSLELETPLLGEFNRENLLAVACAALELGVSPEEISAGTRSVVVPGRFELAATLRGARVVVDYAHTPDALDRVLQASRKICAGRLIVVFGCGGDRDRDKRTLMARAVCAHADEAVVTSDNPRTEDPAGIIEDVLEGMEKGFDFVIFPDRREAIFAACAKLKGGDLLLLAGKGHEDYQIIGTERLPFDDRLVAREATS